MNQSVTPQQFPTIVKTHTSSGRPVAWFSVLIVWQSWAEGRLSNPQTIRGDFRLDQQTPENINRQIQDLLDYLEDNLGMIDKATLYDNRRTLPHAELFKIPSPGRYRNYLPDTVAHQAQHLIQAIEKFNSK